MRIKVKVTEKHIKAGTPEECDSCPIALALVDAGLEFPTVYGPDMAFDLNGTRHAVDMPDSAWRFMKAFDRGCGVEPFEFEIDV